MKIFGEIAVPISKKSYNLQQQKLNYRLKFITASLLVAN
ncbi:hypothetical protein BTU51_0701 [Rickettsia rickettsii]|uniref:Uncharacterized protein n=1 Tax=Rickettsia rickettsii (strain Iowa) TaxID=452659 RepID=B0BXI3_RICRO|nr:hypothetical protein RrIowa_0701 [Rickettsia rickettsii str. Iowa]APU55511.1 hypothetical protein BTU50_0701 [Rickettsia rickettsii]APU56888.1 hypothetical protein BTU51_0701 [Rickettsia rickettsii]